MFADLHLHSYYSDGTQSPEQIARTAASHGIGLMSVTDHNLRAAYPEAEDACRKAGLRLLPGVEVDCTLGELQLHVLAYRAAPDDPALNALLDDLCDIYEQKSVDMLQKLSGTDPRIRMDEYAAFRRDRTLGGWKGLDYLRKKGYTVVYPDCMRLYRGIDWCRPLPDLDTVCRLVHAAGGKTVVAHPGDRLPKEPEAFRAALNALYEHGIDGAECYYPSHSPRVTEDCLNFCRKNGLLITAGSDSHGGFARLVSGVCYDIGTVAVEESELNLNGLL